MIDARRCRVSKINIYRGLDGMALTCLQIQFLARFFFLQICTN